MPPGCSGPTGRLSGGARNTSRCTGKGAQRWSGKAGRVHWQENPREVVPSSVALTGIWHQAQPGPDRTQSRQVLALYLLHSWERPGGDDRAQWAVGQSGAPGGPGGVGGALQGERPSSVLHRGTGPGETQACFWNLLPVAHSVSQPPRELRPGGREQDPLPAGV